MACAEFENLLLEYGELADAERRRADGHVAGCEACSEFLDALRAVDAQLTAQFADCRVSSRFEQTVRRSVHGAAARRPSVVPEVLDFFGWGALVALFALALYWVGSLVPVPAAAAKAALSFDAAWAAGAVFVFVSLLIGARSFAELKH